MKNVKNGPIETSRSESTSRIRQNTWYELKAVFERTFNTRSKSKASNASEGSVLNGTLSVDIGPLVAIIQDRRIRELTRDSEKRETRKSGRGTKGISPSVSGLDEHMNKLDRISVMMT